MSKKLFNRTLFPTVLFFILSSISQTINAQQKLSDFVVYAGPTGTGTSLIGSSITVNGGILGANKLVQTTGNTTINADIYSGDRIVLTNSNIVTGKISARNSSNSATAISIGSSATLGDNVSDSILAKGGINIGGGAVAGIVRLPLANYPYIGPVPASGPSAVVYSDPYIPAPPDMPAETSFSGGSGTVTTNQTYGPGTYGTINYSGNRTLTLKAPLNGSGSYIYYFKAFTWTGNSNKLVFDFNGGNGKFYIYIEGNTDFGKLNANVIGGNAGQILVETHGNGIGTSIPGNSFVIANGSSGGGSKWFGTVYATRAGINIGSGTGSSTLTGALYSATNVSIQSGVTMVYGVFDPCSAPNANAGTDKPLDFFTLTRLIGTSTTPGVSFNWQAKLNDGIIASPTNNDTIYVSVAGTYILTVSSSASCFTKDTVVVTSKLRNVIGSELQSIFDNNTTDTTFFGIESGYVMIDIVAVNGYRDSVARRLMNDTTHFGLKDTIPNGKSKFMITGSYPIRHLPNLNALFEIIRYCRPYYHPFTQVILPPLGDTTTGLVESAGDTTIRTYLVRKGYSINGKDIKIGVISDSYNKITTGSTAGALIPVTSACPPTVQSFTTANVAQDISNGDLPGDTTILGVHAVNPYGFTKNVHVLLDYPGKGSDEGRAMAQIVHDVASGAELYFRTGFFTPGDMALGIHQLKDAGCKVMVDDVTFITEPFLKNGVVAKAVDSVVKEGVTYFSSAGNFSNKSYEHDFVPLTVPIGALAGKKAHGFSATDMFQHVRLGAGNYTFVFQWEDSIYSIGQPGTLYDMDFYLTPHTVSKLNPNIDSTLTTDSTTYFGFNRDNTDGDPIEFIPFTVPGGCTDSVDYNVFIVNNTLTGNPKRIKFIVFRGGIRVLEFNNEGNSTIVGQANADSAIAVGAARFDKAPPYLTPPLIEPFSSVGRTKPNGFNKPTLVGPDAGNTTVHLGQDYPNTRLDGYSNFFGTSAAAPHAAAAAALLIQGKKQFLLQANVTPFEIRTLMQNTAVDMGAPGFDTITGHGLINIDMAMRTFAAPRPTLKQLVVPVTSPVTIPGNVVFTVTVLGENYSSSSKLYYKDSMLASTVIVDTVNGIATALIPQFEDNPPISMRTPPRSPSGTDGGISNSLYFFSGVVTVNANTLTKKYGQSNPPLTSVIKVDGKLLQDTTLTLDSLGLSNMSLVTDATTYSNVGPYKIRFVNNTPPDSLLQKFNYTFTEGVLNIEKMGLKVTPDSITTTAGNAIANLTFQYEFDPLYPPANPAALKDTAKKYHQAFLPANALVVVKDFKKQQAGGYVLSDADLANMNMMTSFKALSNSRKFRIDNNGKLVPRGPTDSLDSYYLLDLASENIYDYAKVDATTTNFYTGYTGYTKKGLLSESALSNGTAHAQLNGLQSMINGNLSSMLNGNLSSYLNVSLAPMINGNLLYYLNGGILSLLNGTTLQPVLNSPLLYLLNGNQLVYFLNGSLQPVLNGGIVYLLNGATMTINETNSYVQIPNSDAVLHLTNVGLQQYLNTTDVPIVNAKDVILQNGLLYYLNGSLTSLLNAGQLVSFLNGSSLASYLNGVTLQPVLNTGLSTLLNTTSITFVNGSLSSFLNSEGSSSSTVTNNTAVVIDETDVNQTTNNYLGALFSINMITGLGEGKQTIVPGVLVNPNFDITYGLGHALIKPDSACLLTHSTAKNITNTAQVPTTMWLSMTTKVSGQLSAVGDSLLFRSGSITFNFVNSTPTVLNMPVPNGMILAIDAPIQTPPSTSWNVSRNMWITTVPKNFASTSDIFVTGALIPSTNGFTKLGGNTNSVMKGMFFSNKTFTDQWGYGLAPYQGASFNYDPTLKNPGDVIAINGNYRAGTPVPLIPFYAGTGNAYTGTSSSFENFTACPAPVILQNRQVSTTESLITQGSNILEPSVALYPNPASENITLAIVPAQTGIARIEVYTINGTKVMETNDGIYEAGVQYVKRINIGKFINGMYLVRIWNGTNVTNRKIVIHR